MEGRTEPPEGWHSSDPDEIADLLDRLHNPPKYEKATPEEMEHFRRGEDWPPEDESWTGYAPLPPLPWWRLGSRLRRWWAIRQAGLD